MTTGETLLVIFKLVLIGYVCLVTVFLKNIIEDGCAADDISYFLGIIFLFVFNITIIICIWKLRI